LWFDEGDEVSIHTLAHAAYEIIHVVSKKKGRTKDLLFDSDLIKKEHAGSWIRMVKTPGNFFKHAKNDHDASLEFDPTLSALFLLYAITGVTLCEETLSDEESAFMEWLCFNKPGLLTEKGREKYINRFSVEDLEGIRSLPKAYFYEAIKKRRRLAGA
jgi:hypothetical protein